MTLLCSMLLVCVLLFAGCGIRQGGSGDAAVEDGSYSCELTMEGGSGKAHIESPAEVVVDDGSIQATLVWSSSHYDYMIVDGVRYDNEADAGEPSTFTVPVSGFDVEIEVTADTTAMSEPHEIEYTLYFYRPGETADAEDTEDTASPESMTSGPLSADPPELDGLTYVQRMENDSAKLFTVDYYTEEGNKGNAENTADAGDTVANHADDTADTAANKADDTANIAANHADDDADTDGDKEYKVITIARTDRFLLVPEGGRTPDDLPDEITVLRAPLDRTYLVSTSVMDPIQAIGAIGSIRLSGTKESGWYVTAAKEAMAEGDIVYAGKYSAPDYELLLDEKCDFAIENTMIYHQPSVKEKLESLGIPVLIERSGYESDPVARLEWIRLYGALYDREAEAEQIYEKQKARIDAVSDNENTGKTIAFFSITSNGAVTIREPGDYISAMIEMGGAKYVPEETDGGESGGNSGRSTRNIQMEEFYADAKDADILIYNSTIEGELERISDLTDKSELFRNFKAVKNGEVYCLDPGFFQQSTHVAEFVEDIHAIAAGENRNSGTRTFLRKLR